MTRDESDGRDSRGIGGGIIPGAPCLDAFTLAVPQPSSVPVLIAVPHAGRAYTPALLERMRNPSSVALRLEDRHVDALAEQVAAATGAALLVAHAPRAMIDLNRATDDIDWEMFGQGMPDIGSYTPSRRARSGLGLIPRRLPGLGELWKRRHHQADLTARIACVHKPYHSAIAGTLVGIRQRWGAALLIDLHSMPPLAPRAGAPSAEFVIGDRFGASCDGGLVGSAFAYFGELGRRTAHNRPYAGGYVLERHAAPSAGLHALQVEIDRRSYLDDKLDRLGKGFPAMVQLLSGLVRRLSEDVAVLGQSGAGRWVEAAE